MSDGLKRFWRRRGIVAIATALLLLSALGPVTVADSPYLYGVHWWGHTPGQPVDTGPAVMLDCPQYGGWSLETVLTHSATWWSASHFSGLYQDLYTNKNVSLITRIDYNWGQTVPSPTNGHYASWPSHCAAAANTLRNWCHIWVIGNEPNIVGEGTGWPDSKVTPAGYAQIYRNVRNAIRATGSSPAGPHIVLIAAPSPGGIIPGIRWMDGDQWLGQVIDNIPKAEIDGFAIHAYGGSIADFEASYRATLALIDSKGLQDRGVYMTEWNKAADPNFPNTESLSAQFVRDAYASVNAWNQTHNKHNIVCMNWFVYDSNQQAGGGWNSYAIEYWKDAGLPAGDPRDLYTAFQQTVDLRYPAGLVGTRGVKADFAAGPTRGYAPLNVQFSDESLGTVTGWSWTFGDGGTAQTRNPSHTYTQVGSYTVTLNVSGNGTDALVRQDYITVLPQPGDFDNDGDVDQADFGSMQACLTGPGIPQTDTACERAKLDGDLDVDGDDILVFARCYSGPGIPATTACVE